MQNTRIAAGEAGALTPRGEGVSKVLGSKEARTSWPANAYAGPRTEGQRPASFGARQASLGQGREDRGDEDAVHTASLFRPWVCFPSNSWVRGAGYNTVFFNN